MTLRITEAELIRDVRAVLDKIELGNEVVIERKDHWLLSGGGNVSTPHE